MFRKQYIVFYGIQFSDKLFFLSGYQPKKRTLSIPFNEFNRQARYRVRKKMWTFIIIYNYFAVLLNGGNPR